MKQTVIIQLQAKTAPPSLEHSNLSVNACTTTQRSAVIPSAEQQRATFVTGSNNAPMTHGGSDIVSVISSSMNNYNDEEVKIRAVTAKLFCGLLCL